MVKLKLALVTAAAVLLPLTSAGLAAAAPAHGVVTPNINPVACGNRTDLFKMWRTVPYAPICYANAGDTQLVDAPGTYRITTGNNTAAYKWADPSTGIHNSPFYGPNSTIPLSPPIDVIEVAILSRA